MMQTILLDSKCLQAMQHVLGTGEPRRLSSFLAALGSLQDVRVLFSRGLPLGGPEYPAWMRRMMRLWARAVPWLFRWCCRPLGPDELRGCNLLILTTRYDLCPYSESELEAIEAFVEAGGSLWLMANHSRVPGSRMGDFTTQDARLARRFGIKIQEACFRMPKGLARLSETELQDHEMLIDERGLPCISDLVVNNCSAINTQSTKPVLLIPQSMVDSGPHGLASEGLAFAVTKSIGHGRVLATSDSGFVCEPDVPGSGPGLFNQGNNQQFVLKAFSWLVHHR